MDTSSTRTPRIALLPYEKRHIRDMAALPLGELVWPEGVAPPAGTVADLERDDHLILFPSSRILYRPLFGVRCRLSLILAEPFAVQARHHRLMWLMWRRFFLVLTHNRRLLDTLPNSRFLAVADPWAKVGDPAAIVKTRRMSLIASGKRSLEGHRMRHDIASWVQRSGADVDLLGRAYRSFEHKEDGLLPYRFSLVIENAREPGYFSEKLLDCFLCEAIPVYWGAPDIGDFFDTAGMVVCEDGDALREAALELGDADYEVRLAIARQNRRKARLHSDHRANAMRIVAHEAGQS